MSAMKVNMGIEDTGVGFQIVLNSMAVRPTEIAFIHLNDTVIIHVHLWNLAISVLDSTVKTDAFSCCAQARDMAERFRI